jgi:O-antigen ligase
MIWIAQLAVGLVTIAIFLVPIGAFKLLAVVTLFTTVLPLRRRRDTLEQDYRRAARREQLVPVRKGIFTAALGAALRRPSP